MLLYLRGDMSDIQPARSQVSGFSCAAAHDARGRRRSKGPKRSAALRDWEWEKLVADNLSTLDSAWCMLLDTPGLAEEVHVESRSAVLVCGFTCRSTSATLTTTRCAVLFRRLLGVSMVSSAFVTYRDAFLFALSVHWDVDVARYDLSPEQSQAAFALVDLLAADLTYGRGRTGASQGSDAASTPGAAVPDQPSQTDDDRAEGAGHGSARHGSAGDAMEVLEKYAMTKKNIRSVRKQAGASCWAIRLGRIPEGILIHLREADADGAPMELDGGRSQCATEPASQGARLEIALDIWSVILRTEVGAQALLKDKYREAKARQKRKAKRADKRERKGKGRGRTGRKGTRSYSSSESSSGSSDVSDSSSDAASRPARKPSSSSASPDYQRVFESAQHAPRAPAFVWIKGELHFRSRNSGDLVNCVRQPKTPCRVCGHRH